MSTYLAGAAFAMNKNPNEIVEKKLHFQESKPSISQKLLSLLRNIMEAVLKRLPWNCWLRLTVQWCGFTTSAAIKWRLKRLGALRIMGNPAYVLLSTVCRSIMYGIAFCFLLVALPFGTSRSPLYIGALFPMTSLHNDGWTGGRGILPAAQIALEHVNSAIGILADFELKMIWNDTRVMRWLTCDYRRRQSTSIVSIRKRRQFKFSENRHKQCNQSKYMSRKKHKDCVEIF